MTINISGSAPGFKATLSVTRKGATAPDERTDEETFSESLCEGDSVTITHAGPVAAEEADDDGDAPAEGADED